MKNQTSEDLMQRADERRRIAARLEAEAAGLEEAATEIDEVKEKYLSLPVLLRIAREEGRNEVWDLLLKIMNQE